MKDLDQWYECILPLELMFTSNRMILEKFDQWKYASVDVMRSQWRKNTLLQDHVIKLDIFLYIDKPIWLPNTTDHGDPNKVVDSKPYSWNYPDNIGHRVYQLLATHEFDYTPEEFERYMAFAETSLRRIEDIFN